MSRDYSKRKDFVTKEMAIDRVYNKHGNKIILLEYKSTKEYAKFHCNICGNEWSVVANSVWGGNGCLNCYKNSKSEKSRFSYDYVKNFIESKNCELISENYINSHTLLSIKFECGHIHEMNLYSFKVGHRCPCDYIDRFRKTISEKTKSKILKSIEESDFKLLSYEGQIFSWDTTITYQCPVGHIETKDVRSWMRRKNCSECTKIKVRENQMGSNGSNWQGGLTEFRKYMKSSFKEWKKESAKNCNYKSVISNKRFNVIHHLYSLDLIIREALNFHNVEEKEYISDYPEEILLSIVDKVRKLHYNYPFGACLTNKEHKVFHNTYGYGKNTPDQFEEFINKIKNKEILL